MPSNVQQKVIFTSPRNFEERSSIADGCVRQLHIPIPALIDNFANTTEIAYTGWPDRLYVIDRNGRIAYKSRPGPFGFEPANMERSLKLVL
jgi:type I thyroxine 5'-deiodinase